jgi:hypothetical protein
MNTVKTADGKEITVSATIAEVIKNQGIIYFE